MKKNINTIIKLTLNNGNEFTVDFKTKKGLIEVIDNDEDIEKYKQIKEDFPQDKVMAIGHAKYVAQIKELQDIVFYDKITTDRFYIFRRCIILI